MNDAEKQQLIRRAYENARLKLVAGTIHRAQTQFPRPMAMRGGIAYDMSEAKLQERGFAEYHIYELPERATLAIQGAAGKRLLYKQPRSAA